MKTGIAMALALIGVAGSLPVRAAVPPQLKPLEFLLGDWRAGASGGALGQGSGTCGFHPSLQDRVIVRTNHAEYPPSGERPATIHDDLMVIYPGENGDGARADYYDNEGHAIRYRVSSGRSGEVTFVSEASAPGPRFRLQYILQSGGKVSGEFSVAQPDAPGDFKKYLTWEMGKSPQGK